MTTLADPPAAPDDQLHLHPGLLQQIRTVLARLEITSNGSTQAWNASGGHTGEPDDALISLLHRRAQHPTPEDDAPHIRYRNYFAKARTIAQVLETLDQAEAELAHLTRRATPANPTHTDRDILRDKILACDGWTADDVARTLRCTTRLVRQIRSDHERAQTKKTATGNSRAAKAAALEAEGLTQDQIGQHLGVSQQTVSRLLRAHDLHRRATT